MGQTTTYAVELSEEGGELALPSAYRLTVDQQHRAYLSPPGASVLRVDEGMSPPGFDDKVVPVVGELAGLAGKVVEVELDLSAHPSVAAWNELERVRTQGRGATLKGLGVTALGVGLGALGYQQLTSAADSAAAAREVSDPGAGGVYTSQVRNARVHQVVGLSSASVAAACLGTGLTMTFTAGRRQAARVDAAEVALYQALGQPAPIEEYAATGANDAAQGGE